MRQWVRIQPFVLWLCWRDENGRIPHIEPPVPTNSKTPPKFRRHLDDIYKLGVYLSVADHILSAKSITLADVKQGMRFITLYNNGAVAMGLPMVINNHLAMHYPMSFNNGPVPSWWLYGFERCNGDQKRVNLNGHSDGAEMEMTLARAWVQKHRLYELVFVFLLILLYSRLLTLSILTGNISSIGRILKGTGTCQ